MGAVIPANDATPWHFDPDSRQLAGGPSRTLTGAEWRGQVWPPCPVCGSTIDVERIDVTSKGEAWAVGGVRRYIVGLWECPNECDPRRVDPRRGG